MFMRFVFFVFFVLVGFLETLAQHPTAVYGHYPIFKDKDQNPIVRINIPVTASDNLESLNIDLKGAGSLIESLRIYSTGASNSFNDSMLVADVEPSSDHIIVKMGRLLNMGDNNYWVSARLSKKAKLLDRIAIGITSVELSKGGLISLNKPVESPFRVGITLRKKGDDNIHTYRIPGLAATAKGTLIAVYDNRYTGSGDLQGDIDVGMSRSTDGGETWEPMRVIMDMGEYGGLPQNQNGIGDPAILVDKESNTIWVAAVWAHAHPNKANWWASSPGMLPNETSQLILVKSTDDGKTWSKPINITPQVKDSSWQLLLQGPGAGIMLKDGTLVFAVQFKKDIGVPAIDGGKYTCHSTILYSKDKGQTWAIGTGAKSNTTEAQVVELADGSLMLNMRDDRNRKEKGPNNGRAVAITTDLGKTWRVHSSSNGALPEPNCMASIIRVDCKIDGKKKPVLFFSNPNSKNSRSNMSIQTSFDEGATWPENRKFLYNANDCYGYSCLTQIDSNTIGVLYEGAGDLYFQKFKIKELIENK